MSPPVRSPSTSATATRACSRRCASRRRACASRIPAISRATDSTALSERLAQLAGPGLECAFFVSSGSEAVEKCLQFARRAAIAAGKPERYKVISRNPSYHGSTRATMALSADPGLRALPRRLAVGHPGARAIKLPAARRPESRRARAPMRGGIARAHHRGRPRTACSPSSWSRSWDSAAAPTAHRPSTTAGCGKSATSSAYCSSTTRSSAAPAAPARFWRPIIGPARARIWRFSRRDWAGGYVPLSAFLAPSRWSMPVAGAGGFHVGHTHKAHPLACAVGLAVLVGDRRAQVDRRGRETIGAYLRSALERCSTPAPSSATCADLACSTPSKSSPTATASACCRAISM